MATNEGFEGDHVEMTTMMESARRAVEDQDESEVQGDTQLNNDPQQAPVSQDQHPIGSSENLQEAVPTTQAEASHENQDEHGDNISLDLPAPSPELIHQQPSPVTLQHLPLPAGVSVSRSYTRGAAPAPPSAMVLGHVSPIVSRDLIVEPPRARSPAPAPPLVTQQQLQQHSFQPPSMTRAGGDIRARTGSVLPQRHLPAGIEYDSNGNPVISFEVRWQNLTYTIPTPFWKKCCGGGDDAKLALDNVSGSFKSGQLVALVGPSGSGKTVLLECLVGQRETGLQGNISVQKNRKRLKVAFVPQSDNLLTRFTVYETLVYASRLKNTELSGRAHNEIAEQIVRDLGLEKCRNNLILACSGGQQKRITIAQELVSHPQILVLDEPTSGLDSTLCYQAMDLLKQLVNKSIENKNPMAIVTVIHQPPARVFNMFDKAFVFSQRGECIYEGQPTQLVPTLRELGCPPPERYNPADFIVEIAAYEYGDKIVTDLIDVATRPHRLAARQSAPVSGTASTNELKKAMRVPSMPFWLHFWIILCRSSRMILRDPMLTFMRLIASCAIPVYFSILFGSDIGEYPGCPEYKKSILSMNHDELLRLPKIKLKYEWEETVYGYMYGFIAFLLMCISYSGVLVTILTFPLEFKVTMREHFNGWYKPLAYYLGRLLAEVPYHVIFPIVTAAVAYYTTNQPMEPLRFCLFTCTMVLVSLVSQCFGILFGAIFVENLLAAVFMTPVAVMPQLLFSGFFTRVNQIHPAMKWLCDASFLRYGFESVLVSLFGFGRCECSFDIPPDDFVGDWVQCLALNREEPIPEMCTQDGGLPDVFNRISGGGPRAVKTCDEFKPIPFTEFSIEQDAIWRGWIGIGANIIILYGVSFLVMLYKLKSK